MNKILVGQPHLPLSSLLIDGDLPIEELSFLAIREGRRPRPIYTAHKWFARRLGSIFRALLVGSTTPAMGDFWKAYYGSANLQGVRVLDPFVGGGTSVFEAQRLGASVIGVDVDPVACSVTGLELEAAQIPDLLKALAFLKKTVGGTIQQFHSFVGSDGKLTQILHHFWVQTVTCNECGKQFEAHPNFRLAKDKAKQWVFCAECGQVAECRAHHKSFRCKYCSYRTVIENGRLDYGRAICPHCHHREPLIQVGRRTGKPPQWEIFALETIQEPEDNKPVPMKDRSFRTADSETIKLYKHAAILCKQRMTSHPDTFPDTKISLIDRTDNRLIDYGYRRWIDLFNQRQLLHLSLLSEAIQNLPPSVRLPMAMCFSDHLTTNCMLTSYTAGWRRLSPLFSLRSFRHVPRPVEINPWMDRTGRGSFPNNVRKLMRASGFARNPKEPSRNGQFVHVPTRKPIQPGNVTCGTARDLDFISEASIDIVLTDPPYFDNIAYSELSEFFQPWLRMLGALQSSHSFEQIKLESLVGKRDTPEALEHYQDGLCEAFGEISRVLKPSGILVFSFRHTLPEAWNALAHAIAPHPLKPVRVLPTPGEAGIGLHAHPGTGLWDAVLVFKKGDGTIDRSNLQIYEEERVKVGKSVSRWVKRLEDSALPFTDVDKTTLWRSTLVATSLRRVSMPISKTIDTSLLQALREQP